MDQERLDYLREWADAVDVMDERDLAHRQTVLELLNTIAELQNERAQAE